jgi:hypothetical protein
MNFRNFFSALTLATALFSITSCVKEESVQPPVDNGITEAPVIPDGNRITIHFGTSTQNGCMYSFSNCIWIGFGTETHNQNARMALTFNQGDEAAQYFGQYFPLTADFTVDQATAASLGIEPQVIPAGFYPLRDAASGQATGKRTVVFDPLAAQTTTALVNDNNPQDNIGQLHNLALQVVLHENRDAIKLLKGDRSAMRKLLTDKTIEFMTQAEVPVNETDKKRAYALTFDQDFEDYTARINESRLSADDKQLLIEFFNIAADIPVHNAEELANFTQIMTELETRAISDPNIDNRKVVLSMVSTLKYSRYYWFWKSISSTDAANGGNGSSSIPEWVWADVIALELGGPVASAVASVLVYQDTH